MNETSFTLLGFTQPQSAMPIIQDVQNNAKGFTSRLIWFFPQPVFCKFNETILETDEIDELDIFKQELGNILIFFNNCYQTITCTNTQTRAHLKYGSTDKPTNWLCIVRWPTHTLYQCFTTNIHAII